jgi:hypothetical protein
LASFLSSNASVVGRDLSIDPLDILTHLTGTRRGTSQPSANGGTATVSAYANAAVAAAAAAAGHLQQTQQVQLERGEDRRSNVLEATRERVLSRRTGAPRSVNASSSGLSVANVIGSNGLPYLVLMDSAGPVNVSSSNSIASAIPTPNLTTSNALIDHLHQTPSTSGPTSAASAHSSTSNRLLLSA